jgi:Patatin-like phospholipase/Protein of unknown function (DUF3376)
MGGVTHEIDLLRRASRVAQGESREEVGGVAEHDEPIFDAWVRACKDAGVGEVLVDVLAGTSAGGLNGTLLATAVARGVALDPPSTAPPRGPDAPTQRDGDGRVGPRLRNVWNTRARLEDGHLLRSPKAKAIPSVLDGDYFLESVKSELANLSLGGGGRRDPVTLFVTATALGTSLRRYEDSFDQGFDVADHRRLYRFRRTEHDGVIFARRPGEPVDTWWTPTVVDDFAQPDAGDGEAEVALATAARASASFPIAFEPVQEGPGLARRRVLPPATLQRDGRRWLVDGGVLDNAPFQPVLDAITRRPVSGPLRRLLVYVVPSRGETAEPGKPDIPARPQALAEVGHYPAWAGIAGSVVGFPREGDVRADLEYAAELLSQAEGSQAGPEAAFRVALAGEEAAASGLLEQYRAARALGGLAEIRAVLAVSDPGRGAKLAPRSQVALDDLLKLDIPWVPPAGHDLSQTAGWVWGLGAAERLCRLMVRDLRTRMRDGQHVDPEQLSEVSAALTRVEALRDAVNADLTGHAPSAPTDDAGLVAWAAARFADLGVADALTYCIQAAAAGYAEATSPAPANRDEVIKAGLVVEVATQAFTAYRPFKRTAPFELLRLGPDVDTPAVDTTPEAAAEARRFGDEKLYGMRLKHFAAFGLPEWRSWDWTVGRLDAQTHLSRALLKREEADAWATEVQTLTIAHELNKSPAKWRSERDELRTLADDAMLGDLLKQARGKRLVLSVVDSLMRALPEKLALDRHGAIANTLLARKPQRRWHPLWTGPGRFVARRRWRRWTKSLSQPKKP